MSEPKKAKWYHIRKNFLFTLLAIFLCIFCIAWWYDLPMGEGSTGIAVPLEPFQKAWHSGKVLMVGMGDSITTGFGAGGSNYGYFERLMKNAPQDAEDIKGRSLSRVFPDLTVMNLASNASSSGEHLRVQLTYLNKQEPDVLGIVALTTGGIDLIHNYGKEPPKDEACYGATLQDGILYGKKFRERLNKLLDSIKERFPGGCKIFLANIYDPTDGVGDIENVHPLLRLIQKLPPWPDGVKILQIFNQHIKEAAEARDFVYLVDIHSVMLGHGIHCKDSKNPHYCAKDPTYWYYFNLEDPNQRGYDAIRRVFLLKMIKAFDVEKK